MKNIKNLIIINKLYKIIKNKNPLFAYHFNNINNHQWQKLKKELHQIGVFDQLVIKNQTVVKKNLDNMLDLSRRTNESSPKKGESPLPINNIGESHIFKKGASICKDSLKNSVGASFNIGVALISKKAVLHPRTSNSYSDIERSDLQIKPEISFLFSNSPFFSGQSLLIGCPRDSIPSMIEIMEKETKLIFLAAFIDDTAYSHLDIAKLSKLDNTVYTQLFSLCGNMSLLFPFYQQICSGFFNTVLNMRYNLFFNIKKEVIKKQNI